MNNYFKRKLRAMDIGQDDTYETVTGIPPLSLPNSKGKNLKSYSISGNVDEEIISYSDNTPLPNGYVLLDYIGTTGTQYLTISSDMQYDTSDIDISIVCTVSAISSSQQTIIGSYNNLWNLWAVNDQMGFFTNGKATDRYTGIASNTKISVRIYQNQTVKKLFVDGNEITTNDTPVINALGLQLFAYSNGTAKLSGRIYSVSGHISSTQINLVPCINPNGEIGMCDTVGNKFYGNAGTGTFTKSPFNLLRTLGRTEQAVSGNSQTKRILQGDKWAKLTAINNIGTPTNVVIGEGSTSFSASANGYGIGFPVKLKPNHSYTVYSDVATSDPEVKMDLRISFYASDGTWLSRQYSNAASSGKVLKSFTVPSNADMTVILCAKSTGTSANTPTLTFSDIMLVEGVYTTSNAPAYTPYKQLLTDYNGVGDKTKNLLLLQGRTEQTISGGGTSEKRTLNCNQYVRGLATNNALITWAVSNVQMTENQVSANIVSSGGTVALPVKLEIGKTYSISSTNSSGGQIRIIYYEADGTFGGEISATSSGTVKTFTIPSNADVTVILLRRTGSTDDSPYTFSNIMLVEGFYTSATMPTYEPYGYKIPVLSSSENIEGTQNNIFITPKSEISLTGTTDFEQGTIQGADGKPSVNTTRIRTKDFIPVLPNTTYMIDQSTLNGANAVAFRYVTASANDYVRYANETWCEMPFCFNTGDTNFIKIAIRKQDSSTITPNEMGTVVLRPVESVSLIKAGENADIIGYPQNAITRMIGKFVFTGKENIELYDNQHGFRFAITDMQTGNCLDGFCNRFENFKNVTDNDVPRVFFGYNNNYVYFRRVTSTSVTKADMQAILADWYSSGKPLTIWYPLEDETEEAVTLPDIPTVRGNATIMIDTEVQPSSVTAEYAKE